MRELINMLESFMILFFRSILFSVALSLSRTIFCDIAGSIAPVSSIKGCI